MKHLAYFVLILTSCTSTMTERMNHWSTFESSTHLQPEMNASEFNSLHSWDFGWELLEPLNKATSDEHEIELSKKFSPGQKALYFFWYLDGQVTNGGFVQFYWNGYDKYLPAITDGLTLIGDTEMNQLVGDVEHYVTENLSAFRKAERNDDFSGAYEQLPEMEKFEDRYFELHDRTMELIEQYARTNTNEFVKLK